MISPGRSRITPEPELPIEPRTSTTLRATSRASSPNASEICVARASTSSVMALASSVGPWSGRDGDVAQVATPDELDTSRCVDRLGTECHLQRLAVLDGALANGQQEVAQEQTALFGGCPRFDAQQHQAAGLGDAKARSKRFL